MAGAIHSQKLSRGRRLRRSCQKGKNGEGEVQTQTIHRQTLGQPRSAQNNDRDTEQEKHNRKDKKDQGRD